MHELEITPCQIARLVLGYLKSEKCDLAHDEFLKTSKHLKGIKGRIITRVDRKNLIELLNEYSQINILIQERIEETNFYNEQNSVTTLLDQLIYLLDHKTEENIKASTPNKSPIPCRLSLSDVGVNTDFCLEENFEVRATSLNDLPGNSRSSCKRKKEKHERNSSEEEEEGHSINLEVLTQSLLEHRQLHEKLADTINVVRNASEQAEQPDANISTDKNNTAAQDVEAAIKTIVQKATSDPFFDRLVKEVIGEEEDETDSNEVKIANDDSHIKFHSEPVENQNPVVVNSSNVVMLQTNPTVTTIDISKPCYLINSTPQQPIYSTGNVLSEQEIMSMPIVVCDDNKQEKTGLGQFIIPAAVSQPMPAPTYLFNLATTNHELPPASINVKKKPHRPIQRRKRIVLKKPEPEIIPVIIQPQETVTTKQPNVEEQKSNIPVTETITPLNEESTITTTTPRSGSHVRALVFSTPQKQSETTNTQQPPNKKETRSWDSDLRGLIKSSPKRETAVNKVSGRKRKVLNKTEEEGKLIEKALLCENKKKKKKVVVMKPTETEQQNEEEKELNLPDTVKRHISLETPVKLDICPQTPGFFSPVNNTDTPLTKVLKEQLDGIDLSTIPTPKFPLTPNIPITPSVDYINRPTDYSSSSSYYHPSDNENNRSLEQLIEECNRLEKDTKGLPIEKQIQVLNEIRIPPAPDELKVVAEKMKTLSNNVVGRKNLKLVEPVEDSDTSCSTCSSSSSSSSSESSPDKNNDSCNQTVIALETPQRYSLRSRTTTNSPASTETITTILSSVKVKNTLENLKTHDEILLEMEEKRKNIVKKLENDEHKLQQKRKNVTVKKPVIKAPRKGKTMPKSKFKTEEALEPFEIVEAQLKENCGTSTPTTQGKTLPPADEETESLVNNLKAILNTTKPDETIEELANQQKPKIEQKRSPRKRFSTYKILESNTKTRGKNVNEKPQMSKSPIQTKQKITDKTEVNDLNQEDTKTEQKTKKVEKPKESKGDKPVKLSRVSRRLTEKEKKNCDEKTKGVNELKIRKSKDIEILSEKHTLTKQDDHSEEKLDEDAKIAKENQDTEKSKKMEAERQSDEKEVTELNKNVVHLSKADKNEDKAKTPKKIKTLYEKSTEIVEKNIEQEIKDNGNDRKIRKTKKIDTLCEKLLGMDKVQEKKLDESENLKDLVDYSQAQQTPNLSKKSEKITDEPTTSKNKNDGNKSINTVLSVEEECEKLMSNLTENLRKKERVSKTDTQDPQNATENSELTKISDETLPKSNNSESSENIDENAQRLVNDLKERGIHLIHNKSQRDKQEPEVTSTTENISLLQQSEVDLFESEFSVCLFHRENVHYKHDPYIRPNKKLSDYDFSLLNKEMNATVYLAEFDAEVQKVMTCTPFDCILDIPSKIDVMLKKTYPPKKGNSLDALNSDAAKNSSPLEGLYDDERDNHLKDEGVVVRKKVTNKKSEHKRARSLSNSHEKKLPEEPTRKSSRIQNRRSSEPKPSGSKEILTIEEKISTDDPAESCKDDAEDELMDYAAAGSPEKCLKKRKADEKPEGGHHIEKKIKPEKCKQLLKVIDVDVFLSHVHGDT